MRLPHAAASGRPPRLIAGCGSAVVDHFRFVRGFPRRGEKAFTDASRKPFSLAGGVTLNHLCWASRLGAHCTLLSLQGADAASAQIRSALAKHGVDAGHVAHDAELPTAESLVYVDSAAARTIVMDRGATASLRAGRVAALWGGAAGPLSRAALVSAEVSQVPLCGALHVLRAGRRAGALAFVDVDVPPDVACGPAAALGSREELGQVLCEAHVVKMPAVVARGVARFLGADVAAGARVEDVAGAVSGALKPDLLVVTDGDKGSLGILRDSGAVHVPAHRVDRVCDTTGAGDAFLGGMLAHTVLCEDVELPQSRKGLADMLKWGSACAALCVGHFGALPVILDKDGDWDMLLRQLKEPASFS